MIEKLSNSGGLLEEERTKKTYKNNLYFINGSGIVCKLPDQIEYRVEVLQEYNEELKDLGGQ